MQSRLEYILFRFIWHEQDQVGDPMLVIVSDGACAYVRWAVISGGFESR